VSAHQIVHIGDVHLQSTHARNVDRVRALDQILDAVRQLSHLALVLIPGDLFHQRSTAEDRNAWAAVLQRIAERAPVAICAGNHDAPGDLEIFSRLKATWPIAVWAQPGVYTVPLATGATAAIACLPYPDRGGLTGAGVAPSDVVPTASDLLDAMCMHFAAELTTRTDGAIPLFMGHVNVSGAIASTGQPQIGQEIELSQAMLARLPVVYCALSHIHKPQEVGAGVYAGSITPMDHGECEEKSYVVIDVDQVDGRWQSTWARHAIDTPPMIHVAGVLTREGFALTDPTADVARRFAAGDWTGVDLRVRYVYPASERAVLDVASVRGLFAGASRLQVEGIADPDRALRAPAVAAAHTLPEKFAAYLKVDTLRPSLAAKLHALEHGDPAQLLADVRTDLARLDAGGEVTAAA
jgi:calcineurin-like phosphoesterase family protein